MVRLFVLDLERMKWIVLQKLEIILMMKLESQETEDADYLSELEHCSPMALSARSWLVSKANHREETDRERERVKIYILEISSRWIRNQK